MATEPFNPLDKRNLGISIANAIFESIAIPLAEVPVFEGVGVYAIYYMGDFPLYRKISHANRENFFQPIYAGKAVPKGSRRGGLGLEAPTGNDLYNRLKDHKKSIEAVGNLRISHFTCRFLLVDDIWIPLGESLLIEKTRPLWNIVLDGFGNHDPGSGRHQQQISPWDTLHPGRPWAHNLQAGKKEEEVISMVEAFLN